ncbi:hypothetical protein ABZ917_17925 [Nonomuraea wenchangensis]
MSAPFEIRFEDPPPPLRTWAQSEPFDYPRIASVLCKKPGRWALIGVVGTPLRASGAAHRIRAGLVETLAIRGAFDAVARSVDGEYRVYARYLGEYEQVAS